jgi:hypothetical protein
MDGGGPSPHLKHGMHAKEARNGRSQNLRSGAFGMAYDDELANFLYLINFE